MNPNSGGDAAASYVWAATIYAAADNDLSRYGMRDLEDLTAIGKPFPDVFLGFELDTRGSQGSLRYEMLYHEPQRRLMRAVAERLVEQDSGDPLTLRNHLDWAARCAPGARHWFVVIWGHGIGRRVAPDRTSYGGALDMPRLTEAFAQAGFGTRVEERLREEGLWSGAARGCIDILGFDACLMGTIENCAHLGEVADIVIASQDLVPARGWPYADVLRPAAGMPLPPSADGIEPWMLAKRVVSAYAERHGRYGMADVILTAVRTPFARLLFTDLNALGDSLARALAGDRKEPVRSALARARDQALPFYLIDYVDLLDLCRRLEAALRAAGAGEAAELAGRIVRRFAQGEADEQIFTRRPLMADGRPAPTVRDAGGLSVWFPVQRALFYSNRATYAATCAPMATDDDDGCGWLRFLTSLHRDPKGLPAAA